jgi:hypothetical protein
MRLSRTVCRLAACAALPALARPAAAQTASEGSDDAGFRIAVAAGPTINDFETTGIDWIFVGGGELRLATWPLVVTADVRYFSWVPAEREQLIMPELGFQFRASLGPVSPFVGLGGGYQHVVRPDDSAGSFTAHLATGMRIRVSSAVDLRLEMRGRSVDPVIGLTAGLAVAL